jgi:integrating conjugative element membrane protein (TIGR03745 family)
MKAFSKLRRHIAATMTTAVALAAGSISIAQAALPTPIAPSTAPAAGNWLELIKGYIKDGGLVLGLAIAVIAFLWISYITISKFNEARMGKAEWGEVGLTGVVAAGVMVFISYLLTEASTTI